MPLNKFTSLYFLLFCSTIFSTIFPTTAMAGRLPYCAQIKAKPGYQDRINAMVNTLLSIEKGNIHAVRQTVLAIKHEIEDSTGITLDLNVCMIMVQKELKSQGIKTDQKVLSDCKKNLIKGGYYCSVSNYVPPALLECGVAIALVGVFLCFVPLPGSAMLGKELLFIGGGMCVYSLADESDKNRNKR